MDLGERVGSGGMGRVEGGETLVGMYSVGE